MQIRKRVSLIISASAIFSAATLARAEVVLYHQNESKLSLGGFVEFDAFTDSTRSLAETAGSTPIARHNTSDGENGRTQFSLRNSRLSFLGLSSEAYGWKPKGYLEFDFLGYNPAPNLQNNQSENSFYASPTLRIRHAYLSFDKNHLQILMGQTWSLFGWQPQYVPANVSVAPPTGSVYERTARMSVVNAFPLDSSASQSLQAALSLVRPTQKDSRIPNLEGGLRWVNENRKSGFANANSDMKTQPLSIAVSATFREYTFPRAGTAVSDTVAMPGNAIVFDAMIPIISSSDGKLTANTLTLSSEFSQGRGYGDEFPGWNGGIPQSSSQGLNLDPGLGAYNLQGDFELVHLRSWNSQLQYHLNSQTYFSLAYAQLYSNNLRDFLGAANITASKLYDLSEVYFVNAVYDFTPQVRAAMEYDQFATHYINDGASVHNHRIMLATYYRF